MPDSKVSNNGSVSIQVKAGLESSNHERAPQSAVYAFTSAGRFLAKAAIGEEGSTVLQLPATSSARDIRVVVGPEMDGEKAVALSALTRRGAISQLVRVQPGERPSEVQFEIPAEIWRCWLRFCVVEGTLLKRVITGGLPVDLPVCGATVQIWEVEAIEILLPKLPITIIEKLRQIVIDPSLAPTTAPAAGASSVVNRTASTSRVKYAQPLPTASAPPIASADFASLQIVAQTSDAESFRQSLVSYIPTIRVWLCELIPRFVTKTLVGTATTDRCGNFEKRLFLSCVAQHPNLYFSASVPFFGTSISIYDPAPIACYTYWGYQCGTNVTLYTDSFWALGCAPCLPINAGENYVLFRAIGGIDLNSIYGATATSVLPATPLGLSPGAVTAGEDSPFGGLLLPRVEFDSSLLENGLAAYYQISYWDVMNGWTVLTGDIYRHYNEFVGGELVTKPFLVGPQPTAPKPNLFVIPPALPPVGDWAYPSPEYDLANAQFPTNSITTATAGGSFGLAQLKLDLFDSSGNAVDIAAAGIKYYVPSTVEIDGTIDTVDASTIGLVSGNSFIMNVYLDNRPTVAELPAVSTSVNSTTTDPCGILQFNGLSDIVDIEYVAYQAGNFLDWSLEVVRGTSGSVASVGGNTSAGSHGSPVDFDNPVSYLNRIIPPATEGCTQAAFGVNLGCTSRCTDGWGRIADYDRSASVAFALTVPCPPCGQTESAG